MGLALSSGVAAACRSAPSERPQHASGSVTSTHAEPEAPGASAPATRPQAEPTNETAPAAAPTTQDTARTSDTAQFAGRALELIARDGRCVLQGGAPVELELEPPCYFFTWREPPPDRARGPSDGIAVGTEGSVMAWRYPSASNATVFAVLGDAFGDAFPADSVARERIAQGYRCAPSVQAVVVEKNGMRAGRKRAYGGLYCVETGMDEKDFWMLAHDR